MNKLPQHFILILLLLFLLLNNISWYQLGGRPLHWDSSVHLIESINANRVGENSNQSLLKEYLNVSWYYPPFVDYFSVPFYKIFGESKGTSFFVMSIFLLVLVISVYAITLRLYNKTTAILSAFIVSMCPIVIYFSRDFMLDIPLAAMVSLSIYWLLISYEFRSTRNSILFGISSGLGVLTRWTFIFFLIIPLIYSFIKVFRKSPTRNRQVINVFISILAGIMISAPWYSMHLIQFVSRLGEFTRGNRNLFENTFYYIGIIPSQISWLITILLLIGLIWYFKNNFNTNGLLYAWFIGSYVIISLISFKEPRFSISLLAPLIIISSAGLLEWINFISGKLNKKKLIYQSVIALIILQFLMISYIPVNTKIGGLLSTGIISASIIPVDGPNKSNWKQLEILNTINDEMQETQKSRAVLSIIPDEVNFNRQSFDYIIKRERLPIQLIGTSGFPFLSNYVLIKMGKSAEDADQRGTITKEVIENSQQLNPLYTKMKSFKLPDGTVAGLFRITPSVVKNVSSALVLQKFRKHLNDFLERYIRIVKDFSLTISESDSNRIMHGYVKNISLNISEADLGDFAFKDTGLRVRNINLELIDVVFNPLLLIDRDSLQLLSFSGVHFNSMTIKSKDLKDYIENSSNHNTIVKSLSLNNGKINLDIKIPKSKLDIKTGVKLWTIKNENIEFIVTGFRINSIPIHPLILNILTDSYNPLLKGLYFLSDFKIGTLSLSNNKLMIKN